MDGLVIGLDLNDEYTQISCYGKEISWTIPTVICRKKEEEIWLTGEEAYAATLLGEGVIVDKLLKMVQKEGTSTIGGVCYTGALLLRIFLQQVLEYPLKEEGEKTVSQLVVTMQEMDARLTDTLRGCHGHFQRQGPCDQSHRKLCILCAEPETGALVQSGRAV